MFRRQAARVQEEPIPEDLIANIPVVTGAGGRAGAGNEATMTFTPVEESPLDLPPEEPPRAAGPEPAPEADAPPAGASALAQQLRYEMGEAFARELDRAEQALNGALAELEARVASAEAALAAASAQAQRERELREQAEARLKAFKELALK